MKNEGFRKGKIYKYALRNNNSNCKIVSMIPGDLAVAGCFNFSMISGGIL